MGEGGNIEKTLEREKEKIGDKGSRRVGGERTRKVFNIITLLLRKEKLANLIT